MNFEESLQKIQTILNQLEDGSLPLEDAIRLYEEGMETAEACRHQLTEAKLRVEEHREAAHEE